MKSKPRQPGRQNQQSHPKNGGQLRISHHRHSGRLRPHEYTSYPSLLILLVVVGIILGIGSVSAATDPSPPPQSGSIGLNGTKPGPPPSVAAVITSPTNQQRFSATPVTVTGTCPATTLVEIFKNDIFAGSGPCSDSGAFSFDIDLLIGQNTLIARVYDAINQPGPDSNSVIVFYDALPTQSSALTPLNFGSGQLLISTDAVFRGSFPERQLNVPVTIIGGNPPYAVNMQWGDTTNKVISRNDNATFTAGHTYKKPGTYQITIQATDAQGRVAFLMVATIINGQPTIAAGVSTPKAAVSKLLVLWPLYVGMVAVVLAFWLGERREKRILGLPTLSLQPK